MLLTEQREPLREPLVVNDTLLQYCCPYCGADLVIEYDIGYEGNRVDVPAAFCPKCPYRFEFTRALASYRQP